MTDGKPKRQARYIRRGIGSYDPFKRVPKETHDRKLAVDIFFKIQLAKRR